MHHLKLSGLVASVLMMVSSARAQQAPDAFAALGTYDFGRDRAPLVQIDAAIRAALPDPRQAADLETKLVAALATPGLAPGAQDYICGWLAVMGSERCVPTVSKLLADERGADLARLTLERMQVAAAGDALREALAHAKGPMRLGLINSLGERREARSLKPLAALLADADAQVAAAAARALGKMATQDALKALLKKGALSSAAVADSVLLCADALQADDAKLAAATFLKVFQSDAPRPAREVAFGGMAKLDPAAMRLRLLDLFADPSPASQDLAVRLIRRVDTAGLAGELVARLPAMPPASQVPVLTVLAELGDAAARPVVMKLIGSPDAGVRSAALGALGLLPGHPDAVDALLLVAAGGKGPEATLARTSLARLRGEGVEERLLRRVGTGASASRRACIAALGDRQAAGAKDDLLALRSDPDVEVRREALRALDVTAKPADLPAFIAWMMTAADDRESAGAEKVVMRLAPSVPDANALLIAQDAAASAAGKVILARCLSKRGGPEALAAVKAYLNSSDAAIRMTGVRALGDWLDPSPLDDLQALVKSSDDARQKTLALRGCLHLLETDKSRSADEKASLCGSWIAQSLQVDDRKLILGSLPLFGGTQAMEIARSFVADPACAGEAKAAIRGIAAHGLKSPELTASHGAGDLGKAIDGDPKTRWTANTPQAPGQWLMLDLHAPFSVSRLVLDTSGSSSDYPRGYQVFVGDDPAALGSPAAEGKGQPGVTEIGLQPPPHGRYVKIVQTGQTPQWYWSIHELTVEGEAL